MATPQIDPDLLRRFFDGEFVEADVAALNDALGASESARREYVAAVYLREGMRRWAHSRGAADELQVINFAAALETPIATAPGDQIVSAPASREHGHARIDPRGRFVDRVVGNGLAIAGATSAVLLVAIALHQYWPAAAGRSVASLAYVDGDRTLSEEDFALSESDSVVARLTATTPDVRWTRGRAPSDFLMRYRPGDILGIDSGIAQVEFSGGARLVLCSPAELQFTGGTSARLIQGSVTGRAESTNFALVTPSATVVDIGTEFGVGVGPSGTDVTVFEGELQVHSLLRSGEGGPMRRMLEGMSMRIDSDGAPGAVPRDASFVYRRDLLRPAQPAALEETVSLLDLVGGHDYSQARIAGSIDPRSGFWGKPPWIGPDRRRALRGDTQFNATPWNRMVDGVFIPRSNAREMQIDSDGHVVHLPPNSGTSWGPIWARRISDIDRDKEITAANHRDLWGGGTLEAVRGRLLVAREGLLGLHANVGITFDLDSVRDARGADLVRFRAALLNLGAAEGPRDAVERTRADLRVFVDGKLKYSRLDFNADDGEADVVVPLSPSDRFLTLVATDSDGDPKLDHVVFVDPVLLTRGDASPTVRRATPRNLYAAKELLDPPPPNL